VRSTRGVSVAGVRIRNVRSSDADQWLALRAALWPEEGTASLTNAVQRFFTESHSTPGLMPEAVLVAVVDEPTPTLVGFAEVSRRPYAEGCDTTPVGFLEGWYVTRGHRRRGVGRALVAAAEEWARELGCSEFASDAVAENLVSAEAHRALGFEEVEIIRCFRKSL
jgi:aminoglycoside 6'-N-acetyltransferase I